ncbi:hypothetical protein G7Y29_02010 [Corynebacterium qintianiae]|uniref:AMIN-like domain-containing protein n=1 Tax=Corynebacterium qintianiae TaxID=2709392 RepID=A0A7T0PF90_9CORY|nr:AMIN domain-containing protein [Corynebacterium qintianiae]QPK83610.1 hypothetical protein G7Y29_02010 [Corynebacterium qintianiae]
MAAACVAAAAVSACSAGYSGDTVTAKVGGVQHAMDQSPKTQRPDAPAHLTVSGITMESHSGFDRLVIELDGTGTPGWFVDYVASPMQETTGKPITITGNAHLNVKIDGTVNGAEETPIDISTSSSNVVDLVNAGTYDGRTQIVVGLRAALPYSVQLLDDPTRLVIDISKS